MTAPPPPRRTRAARPHARVTVETAMESDFRVAADIGGTFTVIALASGDGTVATHKIPSSPEDFGRPARRLRGHREDQPGTPGAGLHAAARRYPARRRGRKPADSVVPDPQMALSPFQSFSVIASLAAPADACVSPRRPGHRRSDPNADDPGRPLGTARLFRTHR